MGRMMISGEEWEFECGGLAMVEGNRDRSTNEVLEKPEDLSGTSAGQSVLIHALDIILRLDEVSAHTDFHVCASAFSAQIALRRM